MGCDIHLHAEKRINGRWEHYKEMPYFRNYEVFGKIAGVRGYPYSERVLTEPLRELPEDVNPLTKKLINDRSEYSFGVLDYNGIKKLEKFWNKVFKGEKMEFLFFMELEKEELNKDLRFVFGFDS